MKKPRKHAKPSNQPDLFSDLEDETPPAEPPLKEAAPQAETSLIEERPAAAEEDAAPLPGPRMIKAPAPSGAAVPKAKDAAAAPFHMPPGTELAEVAVESAVVGSFTYLAATPLKEALIPGARVLVPFGHRPVNGYYLGPRTLEDFAKDNIPLARLKPILKRLDPPSAGGEHTPLLTPELLALARWIARQYACGLGPVLAALLPAGVKRGAAAFRPRTVTPLRTEEELRAASEKLRTKAPKQAALLDVLLNASKTLLVPELLAQAGAPDSALKSLAKAGHVQIDEVTGLSIGEIYGADQPPTKIPELTPAQAAAFAQIKEPLNASAYRAFLLQGVTGSGKTEVYLRALESTLAQGRQGIVLVPEIALTPQTAQRFEERLGKTRVAVLHSQMTEGERAEAWRAARDGQLAAVIGARSALFAPMPKLGCIVVDEEHESSYKQDSQPRYHAREAAFERARASNAVLILGSATPSLESYRDARSGRSQILLLPERVGTATLPGVTVVDLREENRETKRYNYLSRALLNALSQTIHAGEQAILFLNRRGFATVITCVRCGHTEKCVRCDITLTSHRSQDKLTCHYCGFEKPVPEVCSACAQPGVKFWGLGTERVEEDVKRHFPTARVARMDSDTMTRREAYLETLSAFRARKIDILVGTQMIAKGLDFPNVTLVGIVLADTALHMPDFRSRERTFQLLEQVAGRAGRGEKGGRVIVQTHLPADPAIKSAKDHDYEGFCELELHARRGFGYPPFTRLARIVLSGKDLEKLKAAGRAAADALKYETRGSKLQVLGPSPAPIAMLDEKHRIHLLVKAPDGEALAALFAGSIGNYLNKLKGAEALVDIDPQAML